MGRSQGIMSTSSRIRSRRNARRSSSWVSTTGSSATRSSARICLTSVALKTYVARWTNWRTKTTRTTSLQKKLVYRNNWVRTQLVPIRCQLGIDLTSSKHCQPCDSSNTKKIQLISNDGKVIPHLGGTGKDHGGILLMSITTKTDPALIDQGNLLKVIGILIRGMILRFNVLHHYSSKFGNSQQQFTVTDGGCKHFSSNTAKSYVKWLRKFYMKTMATRRAMRTK